MWMQEGKKGQDPASQSGPQTRTVWSGTGRSGKEKSGPRGDGKGVVNKQS